MDTDKVMNSEEKEVISSINDKKNQNNSKLSHMLQHKREPSHRVFVNRSLQLSKIKFFGFDMVRLLATYYVSIYLIIYIFLIRIIR